MLDLLNAALQITAPLLFILILGIFLRKVHFIDAQFIATGNRLVFKVALPCLLFLSIANRPNQESINFSLVTYAAIATLLSAAVIWILCPLIVSQDQKGVFTQCAFRGNMGIIGLALCINAYGDEGLAQTSIYLAVITVLYNVLAVLLLSSAYRKILPNLIKNPLIIAISLGYIWSITGIELPKIAQTSVNYIAKLTLPLALICIGASLDWSSLKLNKQTAFICTLLKLVILPAIICACALLLGIKGQALGILFLMMSTPTAAAAYVMSKQMTEHGNLAAEVITLTTLLSPVSITLGLILLKYYQLI